MKSVRSALMFDVLAYGIGIAAGFFLILIGAWADLESSAYDFPRLANAGLGGLYCPVLMTPEERGTISLNLSNPTSDRISPSVKTQISTALLPEEFIDHLELSPGEAKRLAWPVTHENIDMGRFIFAKVMLFSAHPLFSQETTCGIFIINLPGTGQVLFPILVALSLAGMGWGLHRLNRSRTSDEWLRKHMGPLSFLALLIVLGLLLSFMGGWISSLLLLVVILLLIIILSSSLVIDKAR